MRPVFHRLLQVTYILNNHAQSLFYVEEIIACLNRSEQNITTLHIYKRRGRAKKNLVIHLDSHDVEQCIAELENKGYKVIVRVRNP